jgi:uncharacterized 2Fe-2S/4Fe-4S cluster protein (DUF4445 family)
MKSHKVRFLPYARDITVQEGITVLEAVRRAGLYLRSDCNGRGRCGTCRVRLIEGDAGPLREEEKTRLSEAELHQGFRLACRTSITDEASFHLPEDHRLDLTTTGKEILTRTGPLRPAVREYSLEGLTLSPFSDGLAAVLQALEAQQGLSPLSADPSIPRPSSTLQAEDGQRWTAWVWMEKEVIDLVPHGRPAPMGLALDLGTTTVAVYLWNLKTGEPVAQGAFTNPQIRFGPDIISRIAWSVNHPGQGAEEMRRELLEALNAFILQTLLPLGLTPRDICDAVAVGNPVMHHLFLGLPPDPMGWAPFQPTLRKALDRKAGPLGLGILPTAYVHLLPLIGGFVGSDTTAVILAEGIHHFNEPTLILDLGTNGEILLGDRHRLFACSCATGPAFEGGQLSCGVRAVPGAVERVRLDPLTFEPDYQVVGRKEWAKELLPGALRPLGICGSGVVDLLAALLQVGLIQKNGAFSESLETPRLRKNKMGEREFLLVPAAETLTGRDIVLTQKDIRQIQLAKAAVRAGCKILMDRFGLDSLQHIRIAGAFGHHLDPKNALAIGFFPFCPPEGIVSIGNAAGRGASMAVLDREKRKEAEESTRLVHHVELASEPLFQKEFLRALDFPENPFTGNSS